MNASIAAPVSIPNERCVTEICIARAVVMYISLRLED